jgi:hypothetical protein
MTCPVSSNAGPGGSKGAKILVGWDDFAGRREFFPAGADLNKFKYVVITNGCL